MNRRNLLKLIGLGSIGSIIPFRTKAETYTNTAPQAIKYRNFIVSWTGWKTFPDSIKIVGQWYAHSIDRMWGEFEYDIVNVFVCVPNKYEAEEFLKGAVFNISGGLYVESSEKEKEFEKNKSYVALLNKIDEICKNQEYYRCKNDFEYFANKYQMKIL